MRITLFGNAVSIALTSVNGLLVLSVSLGACIVLLAACSGGGSGEASNVQDASSSSDSGLSAPATATDASALALSDAGAADGDNAYSSCGVNLPIACPDAGAPVYADVAPFFASRCASCHTGIGGAPWPLATYADVSNWDDLVQESLEDCSMPPSDAGSPMPVDERLAILRWLACGLPR